MEGFEEFYPSEVARLVLGYLEEINCLFSWDVFLVECAELQEHYNHHNEGKIHSTKVNGKSLKEILREYCKIKYVYTSTSKEHLRNILDAAASKETSCSEINSPISTARGPPQEMGRPTSTPHPSSASNTFQTSDREMSLSNSDTSIPVSYNNKSGEERELFHGEVIVSPICDTSLPSALKRSISSLHYRKCKSSLQKRISPRHKTTQTDSVFTCDSKIQTECIFTNLNQNLKVDVSTETSVQESTYVNKTILQDTTLSDTSQQKNPSTYSTLSGNCSCKTIVSVSNPVESAFENHIRFPEMCRYLQPDNSALNKSMKFSLHPSACLEDSLITFTKKRKCFVPRRLLTDSLILKKISRHKYKSLEEPLEDNMVILEEFFSYYQLLPKKIADNINEVLCRKQSEISNFKHVPSLQNDNSSEGIIKCALDAIVNDPVLYNCLSILCNGRDFCRASAKHKCTQGQAKKLDTFLESDDTVVYSDMDALNIDLPLVIEDSCTLYEKNPDFRHEGEEVEQTIEVTVIFDEDGRSKEETAMDIVPDNQTIDDKILKCTTAVSSKVQTSVDMSDLSSTHPHSESILIPDDVTNSRSCAVSHQSTVEDLSYSNSVGNIVYVVEPTKTVDNKIKEVSIGTPIKTDMFTPIMPNVPDFATESNLLPGNANNIIVSSVESNNSNVTWVPTFPNDSNIFQSLNPLISPQLPYSGLSNVFVPNVSNSFPFQNNLQYSLIINPNINWNCNSTLGNVILPVQTTAPQDIAQNLCAINFSAANKTPEQATSSTVEPEDVESTVIVETTKEEIPNGKSKRTRNSDKSICATRKLSSVGKLKSVSSQKKPSGGGKKRHLLPLPSVVESDATKENESDICITSVSGSLCNNPSNSVLEVNTLATQLDKQTSSLKSLISSAKLLASKQQSRLDSTHVRSLDFTSASKDENEDCLEKKDLFHSESHPHIDSKRLLRSSTRSRINHQSPTKNISNMEVIKNVSSKVKKMKKVCENGRSLQKSSISMADAVLSAMQEAVSMNPFENLDINRTLSYSNSTLSELLGFSTSGKEIAKEEESVPAAFTSEEEIIEIPHSGEMQGNLGVTSVTRMSNSVLSEGNHLMKSPVSLEVENVSHNISCPNTGLDGAIVPSSEEVFDKQVVSTDSLYKTNVTLSESKNNVFKQNKNNPRQNVDQPLLESNGSKDNQEAVLPEISVAFSKKNGISPKEIMCAKVLRSLKSKKSVNCNVKSVIQEDTTMNVLSSTESSVKTKSINENEIYEDAVELSDCTIISETKRQTNSVKTYSRKDRGKSSCKKESDELGHNNKSEQLSKQKDTEFEDQHLLKAVGLVKRVKPQKTFNTKNNHLGETTERNSVSLKKKTKDIQDTSVLKEQYQNIQLGFDHPLKSPFEKVTETIKDCFQSALQIDQAQPLEVLQKLSEEESEIKRDAKQYKKLDENISKSCKDRAKQTKSVVKSSHDEPLYTLSESTVTLNEQNVLSDYIGDQLPFTKKLVVVVDKLDFNALTKEMSPNQIKDLYMAPQPIFSDENDQGIGNSNSLKNTNQSTTNIQKAKPKENLQKESDSEMNTNTPLVVNDQDQLTSINENRYNFSSTFQKSEVGKRNLNKNQSTTNIQKPSLVPPKKRERPFPSFSPKHITKSNLQKKSHLKIHSNTVAVKEHDQLTIMKETRNNLGCAFQKSESVVDLTNTIPNQKLPTTFDDFLPNKKIILVNSQDVPNIGTQFAAMDDAPSEKVEQSKKGNKRKDISEISSDVSGESTFLEFRGKAKAFKESLNCSEKISSDNTVISAKTSTLFKKQKVLDNFSFSKEHNFIDLCMNDEIEISSSTSPLGNHYNSPQNSSMQTASSAVSIPQKSILKKNHKKHISDIIKKISSSTYKNHSNMSLETEISKKVRRSRPTIKIVGFQSPPKEKKVAKILGFKSPPKEKKASKAKNMNMSKLKMLEAHSQLDSKNSNPFLPDSSSCFKSSQEELLHPKDYTKKNSASAFKWSISEDIDFLTRNCEKKFNSATVDDAILNKNIANESGCQNSEHLSDASMVVEEELNTVTVDKNKTESSIHCNIELKKKTGKKNQIKGSSHVEKSAARMTAAKKEVIMSVPEFDGYANENALNLTISNVESVNLNADRSITFEELPLLDNKLNIPDTEENNKLNKIVKPIHKCVTRKNSSKVSAFSGENIESNERSLANESAKESFCFASSEEKSSSGLALEDKNELEVTLNSLANAEVVDSKQEFEVPLDVPTENSFKQNKSQVQCTKNSSLSSNDDFWSELSEEMVSATKRLNTELLMSKIREFGIENILGLLNEKE